MVRKLLLAITVMLATSSAFGAELTGGLDKPYPAPAISGINAWINSDPLTMESLKGKLVLVDFWAYSCVNCVRTLPHIEGWYKQYADKGLVIIGVHAPEFDFEKNTDNVKHAVTKWGVTYPVALDNDQVTWNNFNNRFWPAHYLIDQDGNVVYTHFGEGDYDVTENNIRILLGMKEMTEQKAKPIEEADDQTPETYLGFARMANFDSAQTVTHGEPVTYHFPEALPMHHWALEGKWTVTSQKIMANEKGDSLRLNFTSKKVFLVLGSKDGTPVHTTLTLNGKPLGSLAGKDAPGSKLTVEQHTLYELVTQKKPASGMLEIRADDAGLEAYAFTFGE